MADEQRVAELEAQVSTLIARIEQLESDRASSSGGTMKARTRCPACGHRKIIHVDQISVDPIFGNKSSSLAPVTDQSFWGTTTGVSPFEVFACAACGFAEWYLTEPEKAASRLRLIDAESPDSAGPYR